MLSTVSWIMQTDHTSAKDHFLQQLHFNRLPALFHSYIVAVGSSIAKRACSFAYPTCICRPYWDVSIRISPSFLSTDS